MTPRFEIVPFTATDGVELQGFLAGGRRRRAIIYLHGLGGNGYRSRMMPALAQASVRAGCAFFSINTRGHDVVASRTQGRRRSMQNGAVYEIFTECVHDLRGAMQVLRARGVRTFYLVGHSTGANKIAYALQRGVRVAKVVYLAPGDDIGIQQQLLGATRYRQMQRLAARWRPRHPHRLMPVQNLGYLDISAASYHSLFGERNRMDQFPFRALRLHAAWRRLARQRVPALLLLGAADEFLLATPSAIAEFVATHLPRIHPVVMRGANHSFRDREASMARIVVKFLCANVSPS